MSKRIAIQGVKGCFHEQAARLFYKDLPDIEIIECDNFEDLYLAMDSGKADAAIMAIENTVSGVSCPISNSCANTRGTSKGKSSCASSRT